MFSPFPAQAANGLFFSDRVAWNDICLITRVNHKFSETMNAKEITKADFLSAVVDYESNPSEWKYLGQRPCLVDFYAAWCGPCRMVAPVLEELAAEYEGRIDVYKVDTEKEQELAAAFGIRSIPSLLFCPKQGQPQMVQGAMPKPELKKMIDEVLLG